MKKKNKQKKEENKLIITIIAVLVIIAIIGGATFAYWSWETNEEQRTHVTVEVEGAFLTIDGTNVTNTSMRPTNDCDGVAALIGEATFTATNGTETNMKVIPMIDIILTPATGRTLDDDDKSHLHWALVDITSTTNKTCDSPDYSGTFNKVAKVTVTKDASGNVSISSPTVSSVQTSTSTTTNVTTALIANISGDNVSKLTFVAPAENTASPTTKTYRLYIWLDSGYTHTNYGAENTDPMQDLSMSVKWSPSSTLEQVS